VPCQCRMGQVPRRLRVFWYYLPVFFWCRHQLAAHQAAAGAGAGARRPLVIGMQAPQVGSRPAHQRGTSRRAAALPCRRLVEGRGAGGLL